ncbi:faciogenital dysplasia protein [Anaeramoeba ignava]|uniref:Faciogenital dysplasia protein n=1 Tax=Anaeramoeba ignava TaxID=1746090 RepID=A0A9Q0R7Z5_ANAIG|nr:faciogenital dysplasia protein [Anaeramoeba ignava]
MSQITSPKTTQNTNKKNFNGARAVIRPNKLTFSSGKKETTTNEERKQQTSGIGTRRNLPPLPNQRPLARLNSLPTEQGAKSITFSKAKPQTTERTTTQYTTRFGTSPTNKKSTSPTFAFPTAKTNITSPLTSGNKSVVTANTSNITSNSNTVVNISSPTQRAGVSFPTPHRHFSFTQPNYPKKPPTLGTRLVVHVQVSNVKFPEKKNISKPAPPQFPKPQTSWGNTSESPKPPRPERPPLPPNYTGPKFSFQKRTVPPKKPVTLPDIPLWHSITTNTPIAKTSNDDIDSRKPRSVTPPNSFSKSFAPQINKTSNTNFTSNNTVINATPLSKSVTLSVSPYESRDTYSFQRQDPTVRVLRPTFQKTEPSVTVLKPTAKEEPAKPSKKFFSFGSITGKKTDKEKVDQSKFEKPKITKVKPEKSKTKKFKPVKDKPLKAKVVKEKPMKAKKFKIPKAKPLKAKVVKDKPLKAKKIKAPKPKDTPKPSKPKEKISGGISVSKRVRAFSVNDSNTETYQKPKIKKKKKWKFSKRKIHRFSRPTSVQAKTVDRKKQFYQKKEKAREKQLKEQEKQKKQKEREIREKEKQKEREKEREIKEKEKEKEREIREKEREIREKEKEKEREIKEKEKEKEREIKEKEREIKEKEKEKERETREKEKQEKRERKMREKQTRREQEQQIKEERQRRKEELQRKKEKQRQEEPEIAPKDKNESLQLMLEMETVFQSDLKLFKEHYVDPVSGSGILKQFDCETLFGNIDLLLKHSADFLSLLQKDSTAQNNWVNVDKTISQIRAELFKDWAENFDNAMYSMFLFHSDRDGFGDLLQRCKKRASGVEFLDFLIIPLKQIARYLRHLKALLMLLDHTRREYARIYQVYESFEMIMEKTTAQQQIRRYDGQARLAEIENSIDGLDDISIVHPGRELLTEGILQTVFMNAQQQATIVNERFFLFNDEIITAKIGKKGKLKFRVLVEYSTCVVRNIPDNDEDLYRNSNNPKTNQNQNNSKIAQIPNNSNKDDDDSQLVVKNAIEIYFEDDPSREMFLFEDAPTKFLVWDNLINSAFVPEFKEPEYNFTAKELEAEKLSPLMLEEIPSPEKTKTERVTNIITEIMKTEEEYIRDIETIRTHFRDGMLKENLITQEDVAVIFSNIDEIYETNKQLMETLNSAFKKSNENYSQIRVGPIFSNFASKFRIYTNYCLNQTASDARTKECIANETCAKHLNSLRENLPECKGLDLFDFLIKPIQRITKYPLLFKELLRSTARSHSAYQEIMLAYSQLVEVATYVNDIKKSSENEKTLARIESVLSGLPKELGFVDPARKLIREASDLQIVQDNTAKDIHFWLFSDMILVAKPIKKERSKMIGIFLLDRAIIREFPSDELLFQVVPFKFPNEFTCVCDCVAQKLELVTLIKNQIREQARLRIVTSKNN